MNPRETCRTCLGLNRPMRAIDTVNVAKVGFKHISAIEVLGMFTDITISMNDGLPDQICIDCLEEIQRIYSFKLTCEKSNSELMGLNLKKQNVIQQYKNDRKLPQLPYTIQQRLLIIQVFYESDQSMVATVRKLRQYFGVHNAPCKRSVQALVTKLQNHGSICDVPISEYEHKRFENKKARNISIGTTKHPEIDKRHCDVEMRNEFGKEMDKIEIIEKQSEGVRFIVKYRKSVDAQEPVELSDPNRSPKIEIKREEEHATDHLLENIKTEPDLNSIENDCNLEGHDSDVKLFDCPYKSPKSEQLENNHIIDNHREQKWCEKDFHSKQDCAKHLPRHRSNSIDTEENFQCLKCLKSFNSQDTYQEHVRVHLRRFKCDICSESFSFEFGLKHHLKRKHGPSTSSDGICSKSFELKISSTEHSNSDSDKESFECEICSDVFGEFENLRKHLKKHPDNCKISSKKIRLTQPQIK